MNIFMHNCNDGKRMRQTGKLVRWNDEKGFGFIQPGSSSKDIFVHISSFPQSGKRPRVGMHVTFEPSHDSRGRACAVNVSVPGTASLPVPMMIALLFFAVLGLSIYLGNIPLYLLWIYLILTVVTFTVYAHDKSAAQRGSWRINESTLHLLSLFGGWPGGLIARHTLRHKTIKQPFRFIFWCTVLGNIAMLTALQFGEVRELLRGVM